MFDQRLTEVGDGTGNSNANGIYTVGAPGEFFVQPPDGEYYDIFSFRYTFTSAGVFSATGYGDGAILTNGVKVTIENATTIIHDMLGGVINTNAGWGTFIDIDTIIEKQNDPAALTGEAIFVATYGQPFRLFGSLNQKLVVTYQDDMDARLTNQICSVAGTSGKE